MANCLLVGGGGFFGGHLTRRLLGLGHRVIVFDCKPYPASVQARIGLALREKPWGMGLESAGRVPIEYFQVDVTDPAIWIEAKTLLSEADIVYMLAGLLGSGPCTSDMTAAVQRNVLPMALLIDALVRTNARPLVVHASSDLVYGLHSGLIPEYTPGKPICGYSVTKLASEGLLRTAGLAYGIPSSIFRISTTYGPYQQRNSLVNLYIERALCDGPLPVYGLGLPCRDWLYIDDAISALTMPVVDKGMTGVFNVPGDQHSIWEVANTVKSVMGRGHIERVEWPKLTHSIDVGSHVLDGEKICGLGWELNVDLERGIILTAEWMRKRDV